MEGRREGGREERREGGRERIYIKPKPITYCGISEHCRTQCQIRGSGQMHGLHVTY